MAEPSSPIDHLDVRVRSLPSVEAFYDAVMPELGLPRKTFAYVDPQGDWHDPDGAHPYNTIEYHATLVPGYAEAFIGFIEAAEMTVNPSRIALRVATAQDVLRWADRLRQLGASNVELSEDMDGYPAVFFNDPAGTYLELCARKAKI